MGSFSDTLVFCWWQVIFTNGKSSIWKWNAKLFRVGKSLWSQQNFVSVGFHLSFWNRIETNCSPGTCKFCLNRLTKWIKLISFLQRNSNFIYGFDIVYNLLTFSSIYLMRRPKCVSATVPPRKYKSLQIDRFGFSQIRFTEQTHWTNSSQFMNFIFGVNSKQKFHFKQKFRQSCVFIWICFNILKY